MSGRSKTILLSNLPGLKRAGSKTEGRLVAAKIITLIYDNNIEFLLPDSAPPWKENQFEDEAKSLLFREARRLRIFVKGGGYDHLPQIKRETLFIQLLQDIDNDDAKLLANNMLSHKAVKGLTRKTLEEAYPTLFKEPIKLA